jgi:predicted amidophosphoribosyltransferase
MNRLQNKIQVVVDYLLGFVLDDLEVLKRIKKIPEESWNEWLKNNFGLNLKKDLPNFKHLYNYEHKEIQDMVWQLKFNDNYFVAEVFGRSLAETIRNTIRDNQNFYLIPIPIHNKRRRERGYNQCEWLCENILKIIKKENLIYKPNLLIRKKYTKKQSWNTNRNARLSAVENIYSLNSHFSVSDKNFIIIDDAGAKKILILTIAH